MTDYNDGKWHGWNGGECPVHPKAQINVIWDDMSGQVGAQTMAAGDVNWASESIAPCVFRVVKVYLGPRERWSYGAHMYDTLAEAEAFRRVFDVANPGHGYRDRPITRWVEDIE